MVHGAAIQYFCRSRKGSRQTAAGQDDRTAGVRGGQRGGQEAFRFPRRVSLSTEDASS